MSYNFSDRLKNLGGNAIREIFKVLSNPNIISFAGGFPPKANLPIDQINDITNYLLNSPAAYDILQYGPTEGYKPFIEQAIEYVKRYSIENVDETNTLIISGGQQGIDLMGKCFVNKGDCVLVENPTYLASIHILKTYEAKIRGVKSSKDGLDLVDLEKKIIRFKPKFIYLVPTFSNPTGREISLEKRKQIIDILNKYDVMLLEDDPYSELRFEGERVPSIKSLDTKGKVVYITSFSKTIAPGLRTGIAIGPSEVIRKFTIAKQAVDVHTSALSQAIIAEYLKRGYIEQRILDLLPEYKEKRDTMLKALKKYMPKEFKYNKPNGGLFIWGEFKKSLNINVDECFQDVVKRNVAYVSGSSFFADKTVNNCIRLNYSNSTCEEIEIGIKALGDFFTEVVATKKENM